MVDEEISRLRDSWHDTVADDDYRLLADLLGAAAAEIDLFDQVQLARVIRTCRSSQSLSAAGRTLYAASRARRSTTNDGDRLKKYLARFGLDWQSVNPSANSAATRGA